MQKHHAHGLTPTHTPNETFTIFAKRLQNKYICNFADIILCQNLDKWEFSYWDKLLYSSQSQLQEVLIYNSSN